MRTTQSSSAVSVLSTRMTCPARNESSSTLSASQSKSATQRRPATYSALLATGICAGDVVVATPPLWRCCSPADTALCLEAGLWVGPSLFSAPVDDCTPALLLWLWLWLWLWVFTGGAEEKLEAGWGAPGRNCSAVPTGLLAGTGGGGTLLSTADWRWLATAVVELVCCWAIGALVCGRSATSATLVKGCACGLCCCWLNIDCVGIESSGWVFAGVCLCDWSGSWETETPTFECGGWGFTGAEERVSLTWLEPVFAVGTGDAELVGALLKADCWFEKGTADEAGGCGGRGAAGIGLGALEAACGGVAAAGGAGASDSRTTSMTTLKGSMGTAAESSVCSGDMECERERERGPPSAGTCSPPAPPPPGWIPRGRVARGTGPKPRTSESNGRQLRPLAPMQSSTELPAPPPFPFDVDTEHCSSCSSFSNKYRTSLLYLLHTIAIYKH